MSSESESRVKRIAFRRQFQRKPNPCYIPHIVYEILSYLPYEELQTCRLVSRQWNEEACKFMYPRNSVTLRSCDEMKAYNRLFGKRPDFCDNFHLGCKLSLEMRIVKVFFSNLGPFMKSLRLNKIRWTESLLEELIFEKLPNLEELVFEVEENEWTPNTGRQSIFHDKSKSCSKLKRLCLRVEDPFARVFLMRDFILAAPNLVDLSSHVQSVSSVDDWNWLQNPERFEIMDVDLPPAPIIGHLQLRGFDFFDIILAGVVFYDIRPIDTLIEGHDQALRKLERFDLKIKYNTNILYRLTAKLFPLKFLNMPCLMPDVSIETMAILLRSIRSTLLELKVKFDSRGPCASNMSMCVFLDTLTSLSFENYIGPITFIKHLNQLESLTLIKVNFNSLYSQSNFDFTRPLPVKKLNIQFETSRKMTLPTAQGIIRVFPHLTNLRLEYLTDSSLKIILAGLPNIEILSLMECKFSDAAFTGINQKQCEILDKDLKTKKKELDNEQLEILRGKSPWIGNLKRLRAMELGSSNITDVSVVYGISKCREIRKLLIMAYGITDRSLKKIVDDMDIHYFETRLCNQMTVPAVEYARKKLKGRKVSINEYRIPDNLLQFLERNRHTDVTIKLTPG